MDPICVDAIARLSDDETLGIVASAQHQESQTLVAGGRELEGTPAYNPRKQNEK